MTSARLNSFIDTLKNAIARHPEQSIRIVEGNNITDYRKPLMSVLEERRSERQERQAANPFLTSTEPIIGPPPLVSRT